MQSSHLPQSIRTLTSRLLLTGTHLTLRARDAICRSRLALQSALSHLRRPAQAVVLRMEGVRSSRIQTAAVCFTLLLVLPMAANMRPSVHVTYNGIPIGSAANMESAMDAAAMLESDISELTGTEYQLSGALDYSFGFSTKTSLQSTKQTAQAIVEAADDIETLSVLRIDGETIAACESAEEVQAALDAVTEQYADGNETASSRLLNDVYISTAAAPTSLLTDSSALASRLTQEDLVQVEITETVQYTEAIPFETVTVDNPDLAQNKTITVQEGMDGEAAVTAEVVLVNGEEQSRTIVSRAVLSEATTEVVQIGTKNIGIGTGTLQAPLTSYRFTSGFKFRSGRWHKGVDLCTPTGSAVYAADNGRVIVSEWSDSFGYYIIIDHQNGMKTLYAHNSSLIAQVGDVVEQGQQIALSGNTGRSSAPHVHFEVHVDGEAVNPEIYLGL